MSDGTKIEWAEASVNPLKARNRETGKHGWFCTHVSGGCVHCYSEALNHRLGTGIDYRAQDRNKVDVYLDEKILTQPLRWKRGRRIFWNSMSDSFGEFVPDEWIDRMCAIAALTSQHQHLFLTKRAERMRDYLSHSDRMRRIAYAAARLNKGIGVEFSWPFDNMWAGVSVEDQARADERIPPLLETPAAVRWISAEPLLGLIDLMRLHYDGVTNIDSLNGLHGVGYPHAKCAKLDWVVVGGESGPKARPFNIEWARSIIAQCKAAKIPVFIKQLGAMPYEFRDGFSEFLAARVGISSDLKLRDRKGGDISEFPEDLRIREYPS